MKKLKKLNILLLTLMFIVTGCSNNTKNDVKKLNEKAEVKEEVKLKSVTYRSKTINTGYDCGKEREDGTYEEKSVDGKEIKDMIIYYDNQEIKYITEITTFEFNSEAQFTNENIAKIKEYEEPGYLFLKKYYPDLFEYKYEKKGKSLITTITANVEGYNKITDPEDKEHAYQCLIFFDFDEEFMEKVNRKLTLDPTVDFLLKEGFKKIK